MHKMWDYTSPQIMITLDVLVTAIVDSLTVTHTVVRVTAFAVRVFTMVTLTGVGVIIVPNKLKKSQKSKQTQICQR